MISQERTMHVKFIVSFLLLCMSYQAFCLHLSTTSTSCEDRCDQNGADSSQTCQCNKECVDFDDCCDDYDDACLSCEGRCDQIGVNPHQPCQCNPDCTDHDDCCDDHADHCTVSATCDERCDQVGVDPDQECQCNPNCVDFDDCCSDYEDLCGDEETITDDDLKDISATLWTNDVNRLPENAYDVNTDGTKLFGFVNEKYFDGATFAAFIDLLDNYEPDVNIDEPACSTCDDEVDTFLDAALDTEVMKLAWAFLQKKGLATSKESEFKAQLKEYWFYGYSRKASNTGSTGFEHVFVGEYKGNSVSGFHSWIQFYLEEKAGDIVYDALKNTCAPDLIAVSMDWEEKHKAHGSLMYGVSPEFELATFSICFAARRNQYCPTLLDGVAGSIVTYDMSYVSTKTVGTAYHSC